MIISLIKYIIYLTNYNTKHIIKVIIINKNSANQVLNFNKFLIYCIYVLVGMYLCIMIIKAFKLRIVNIYFIHK